MALEPYVPSKTVEIPPIHKTWTGTTTTTGGAWSVDYSSAGFASPPIVVATAQLQDVDIFDRAFASLSSAPTTTNATGYSVRGSNMLILGSSVRTAPDGTIIYVIAIGETY